MSRIGKQIIILPAGINYQMDDRVVKISGPKGELTLSVPREVNIEKSEDGKLSVSVNSSSRFSRAIHGTIRAILANMVKGVETGWDKKLEITGTGYRAEVANGDLVLTIGFSHPVKIAKSEGIEFKVEKNVISIEGPDRALVGQTAAKVRGVRPPEPYKGKGIAYVGEKIRRKAGKAAKTAGAA